jgi:hypothetical protein
MKIDLSGIVGLLTTKAEFGQFKTTVHSALTKIEELLKGLQSKVRDANETNEVLGRLLATLARKGLVTQDDIIEVSREIEEGKERVREFHEEHKEKPLVERLELLKAEGVDELAVEEYEHVQRRHAANRIVRLHADLSKPQKVDDSGKVLERGKTFAEIVEVIRAEGHPEEQVREYLRAFFPWADGRKGPGEVDVLFCPECDKGAQGGGFDEEVDRETLPECDECGRRMFFSSEFVRPEKFGGKKEGEAEAKEPEGSETPEAECICHETVHGLDECPVHGKHPAVTEAEKVVEDRGLLCPEGVEKGEGFYDPATSDPEDDGFPCCAGCGTKRTEHKRTLKVVETEGTDDHSEDEVEDDSRDDE